MQIAACEAAAMVQALVSMHEISELLEVAVVPEDGMMARLEVRSSDPEDIAVCGWICSGTAICVDGGGEPRRAVALAHEVLAAARARHPDRALTVLVGPATSPYLRIGDDLQTVGSAQNICNTDLMRGLDLTGTPPPAAASQLPVMFTIHPEEIGQQVLDLTGCGGYAGLVSERPCGEIVLFSHGESGGVSYTRGPVSDQHHAVGQWWMPAKLLKPLAHCMPMHASRAPHASDDSSDDEAEDIQVTEVVLRVGDSIIRFDMNGMAWHWFLTVSTSASISLLRERLG